MSTKIEIRLAKAESIHWKCLEYTGEIAVVQRPNVSSGTFHILVNKIFLACRQAAAPFPLLCVHYLHSF